MTFKFSDDQIRANIYLKLSDKYEKLFTLFKGNAYKVDRIWSDLATEVGLEGKGKVVREKFNECIKQFRKKIREQQKWGFSPKLEILQ